MVSFSENLVSAWHLCCYGLTAPLFFGEVMFTDQEIKRENQNAPHCYPDSGLSVGRDGGGVRCVLPSLPSRQCTM